MPIDIRADVTCSLGTLISGSFADDYLQGNGLIKTRGEVVLDGTQTPDVGTRVTFSYSRGGSTYTIPRTLRVIGSFADPFRRTTTVQLGCKLTYLENRKPPPKDPNTKEENSSVACNVYQKATIPISASYVFQQCIDALELTSSQIPLTNKFSVEEFDLTAGYVQVMSDLLQSEGYAGYLDSSETLQILDLTEEGASGPQLTKDDIADLGPIGFGDLPAEAVIVRYSSLRLRAPESGAVDDELLKRLWEIDETKGAPVDVTVSYTDDNGETISDTDQFYPFAFTATRYDKWDRKIESVGVNYVSLAEVNNRYASDLFKTGGAWNKPVGKMVREFVKYKTRKDSMNDTDLSVVVDSEPRRGIEEVKRNMRQAIENDVQPAVACIEKLEDGYDIIESQTTETYFSEAELAGSLNVDSYIIEGSFVIPDTLVDLDLVPDRHESTVSINYDTDPFSGISKTLTERWISYSQTVSGQQDLAAKVQEIDTDDLANSIAALIAQAAPLVYVGAETNLHTQREYGLQKRPPQVDRNNTANQSSGAVESTARFEWVLGSSDSTAVLEFSLPYAPDDEISWNPSTQSYSSTASDAPEKAVRYGRVQNSLLLGNRNGISLQVSPDKLPKKPFDPLYIQASGLTGCYRVNGTSWAFDANGIVASTDAMQWGAVSASPGTDLSSSWIPIPSGITSLPEPYTPSTGGLDSETGVTYSAVITPTAVIKPYIETVFVEGRSRSTVAYAAYPYTLERGTATTIASTRTGLTVGSRIAAEAGSFALGGQDALFSYLRAIRGSAGSFAVVGYGAGSIRDYRIGTNVGAFALSGQNATVAFQRNPLNLEAGSFALTGQDSFSRIGINLLADSASYSLSGQDAGKLRGFALSGDVGSFALTGQAAALTLPPPTDPFASSVSLLLHMDGTNGSTTFVDKSNSANTVTVSGTASVSTSVYKFGTGSLAGSRANYPSTHYLSVADSSSLEFGSGDFTIECWFYITATNSIQGVASKGHTGPSNLSWTLYYSEFNGGFVFGYSADGSSATNLTFGGFTAATNTWYHVALTRSGSNLRMFVGGSQIGSTQTISATLFNGSADVRVGWSANFGLDGYVDEFRLTKGVARYTANFTAPTAAFADP